MRTSFITLLVLALLPSAAWPARPLTEPTEVAVAGVVSSPLVVSDGEGFLSLWSWRALDGDATLLAQAIDGAGNLGPTRAFAIDPSASVAAATWMGEGYALIIASHDKLYFRKLDRTGLPIGSDLTEIASGLSNVRVAWNGSKLLLAATSIRPAAIHVLLLDRDGAVMSRHEAWPVAGSPDVSPHGRGFLIAFSEPRGVFTLGVGDDGNPDLVPGRVFDVVSGVRVPGVRIATNGSSTLVVSSTAALYGGFPFSLNATLVGPDSVVGPPVSLLYGVVLRSFAVTWDGTHYVVTASAGGDSADIHTFRLGPDGRVAASAQVTEDLASQDTVDIASNGRQVATIWRSETRQNPASFYDAIDERIFAAVGDPFDAGREKRLLSRGAPQQESPVIGSSSLGHIVAWRESEAGLSRIMARFVDAEGNPSGEPVILDAAALELGPPRVAWGESEVAVVWNRQEQLLLRRLSVSGSVDTAIELGELPFDYFSNTGGEYDIAAAGSRFLIVWPDQGRLRGALVEKESVTALPSILEATEEAALDGGSIPWIASNGRTFMVALTGSEGVGIPECPPVNIHTLLMNLGGNAIPGSLTKVAAGHAVAVASDGEDYVVLGKEGPVECLGEFEPPPFLVAHRLSATGAPLEGDGGILIAAQASEASVEWVGQRYVLAWTASDSRGQRWIVTRDMTADGALGAARGVRLSTVRQRIRPALGGDENGDALLVWPERSIDPPGNGVSRIVTQRLRDAEALPPPPEAPASLSVVRLTPSDVSVRWNDSDSEDGYLVEVQTANFFRSVVPVVANETTVSVYGEGLKIRVRAWNLAGVAPPSAEVPIPAYVRRRAGASGR